MPADPIRVDLPATREALSGLSAGDEVRLFGPVFTARDATHERLVEDSSTGGGLPFGLTGQTLFYAGPTPSAAGRPAGAIGPTTASRMDSWTAELLDQGIVATIGKGARAPEIAAACARTGAVYFAAVGGAAALLASRVSAVEPVAYGHLGTEALQKVTLEDFPAFVGIDAAGRDLFVLARDEWGAEEQA